MPKVPDDMEAFAVHNQQRQQQLALERAANAGKREKAEAQVRKYAEELAAELGTEVGNITVFMCNRGKR